MQTEGPFRCLSFVLKGALFCSLFELSWAQQGSSMFGIQPTTVVGELPPSQATLTEAARQRSSGGGHTTYEVPNLYSEVVVPDIRRVELPLGNGQSQEFGDQATVTNADRPPTGYRNPEVQRDAQIGNTPDGDCSGEPGKDISVYLPADRNQAGKIVVNDPSGGEPIVCNAKGKGIAPRSETKGDTPIGNYQTVGFGGNSNGTWGKPGIQLKQDWTGQGTGENRGRGNDLTDDLFIHTKRGMTEEGVLGASSWGCVIISDECMSKITLAMEIRNQAQNLSMTVKERECR